MILIGITVGALAYVEGSLFRNSYIVDRALLDYISFPFAFGLLVPVFFIFGSIFYYTAPKTIFLIVNTIKENDYPKQLFSMIKKIISNKSTMFIIAAASLLIVVLQKIQWIHDPGTAFVDLTYPGGIVSLTGIYFTVISWIIYNTILQLVFRSILMIIFIGKVFAVSRMEYDNLRLKLNILHPDNCNGLRPVGSLIGLFYFLMVLLGAQVLLNVVEKLQFYENLDIVIQSTFLSVGIFGIVYLVVVPATIGFPLLRIHFAFRQYRYEKLKNIAQTIDAYKDKMNALIKKATIEDEHLRTLNYLSDKYGAFKIMPLWPFDLKGFYYFIGSNIIPIIAFLIPLVLQKYRILR